MTIFEYQDGKVRIECNGKALKAIPYKEAGAPAEIVSSKELLDKLASEEKAARKKKTYKPNRNHPWKQSARRRSKQFI